MFVIENGKITSDKTLDIGKIRVINLVFKSDLDFADDDKFKLFLGDIQSVNFAFVNDGCFRFSYVNVAEIIKKENTDLTVKVTCNDEQILSDSITITAYVQGGGSGEEIQGIIYNAFPLNQSTQVKFIPSDITKDVTSFDSMFNMYKKLTSISLLDSSNCTDFQDMFRSCEALTSIPQIDLSKGTNFSGMFYSCKALTSIPQLNTSNGSSFYNMFYNCSALISIPQLDASNGVNSLYDMFRYCSALTDFGGLLNAKKSFSLSDCYKLTHQSLLNVLNGLYDLTGSTSQTLTLGGTNLNKLTAAEKAIATNKNWVLA